MDTLPDIGPFRRRLEEIDASMAAPDFFADQRRAATLSREHQSLTRLIETYDAYEEARKRLADNRAMADDASVENELRAMASEEIESLESEVDRLRGEVLRLMIPPEESDQRNIVVEIRGGAGGDEANIFAGDLARMYHRYAESRGWKVEPISSSPAESGGFKESIFKVAGEDVYRELKFESGVHRVQRVPVTEAGGRIHTSTATVAVLPEAEEIDVEIDPNDIEITTTRASGAGGQHVNTTDSAVQLLHKSTGTMVYCADERSQHKNRAKAMTVLRSRLLRAKEEAERAKYVEQRRGQIGGGERSERIRTYNFPQSRVTDHRIGLNLSLGPVIEGELDPLLRALHDADAQAKIEALLERQRASSEG